MNIASSSPLVPEHWEVRRIANIADLRVSNVDKHFREEEEPIRLCNYVDVYHNERIRGDLAFMPATARKAEIQRFRMVIGDVLLTKDSEDWADIGVPALVEYAAADLVCGYHLAMLRPNRALLDAGYLFRALADSGVARQFRVAANGVTRYGLSRHAIRSVRIPLPPMVEQRAIVRFLDHADRRIQRYIRAKERLIELLEEQKQAIIHRAVTGQIDVRTGQPYPAYKDSGVEWLRVVPEHWEVRRSKRLFRPRKERARPNDIQLAATQAYGVIAQSDYEARVGRKVVKIFRHLDRRRHVKAGDFVISMRSFQGGLERAWISGCIRSSYVVLRPTGASNVGYFSYLFKSTDYITALQSTANFIRDGQDLNFDNFRRVDLPLPPIEEQRRIAAFLDRVTADVGSSVAERSRRQVELMQEYRTRLIADVVTGKLDICEAAASLPETDPLTADDPNDNPESRVTTQGALANPAHPQPHP